MGRRTTMIRRNKKTYKIYDAFPNKSGAKRTARDARKHGLGPKGTKTRAIVYDLGKNAGRLRYAVFTRIER